MVAVAVFLLVNSFMVPTFGAERQAAKRLKRRMKQISASGEKPAAADMLRERYLRDLNPLEAGVVTVGSIHGGRKHNVLADRVKLEITVRADTEVVRQNLLSGIRRIARGVALTHGVAEADLPTVEVVESTPPNENDPTTVALVKQAITGELGEDAFYKLKRESMGAEDFAYFVATEEKVPGAYFVVGGSPPAVLAAAAEGGPPAPVHHSPFFKVEPEGSIVTGVRAMTAAVMELLPAK